MKLTIHQNKELQEEEILIHCIHVDKRIKKLADYIRQFTFSMEGETEGKQYQLSPESIYYIDSVDGKTFLYDDSRSYLCRQTLSSLEILLRDTTFVRISKNCILNTAYLKCVAPFANHRMKAELKNGEHLLISRNYIDNVKEKIRS